MELHTFRTTVPTEMSETKVSVNDTLFLIGSCFADNISEKLRTGLMQYNSNPYGTAYNPASISRQLQRIMRNEPCTADELIEHNGLVSSWLAHSKLSSANKLTTQHNIDSGTAVAHADLKRAKLIIITFGTARIYRLSANNQIVANCHKLPEKNFTRELLTPESIEATWHDTIDELRAFNPTADILFTVSPIRHLKDTAHGNQLSKATLLLAIDNIIRNTPHRGVKYFPAYEIMMDDLRDYRFYADDMTHPSPLAINYIYQQFAQSHIDSTAQSYMNEAQKISAAMAHRPINTDGNYLALVENIIAKIDALVSKYRVDSGNRGIKTAIKSLTEIKKALNNAKIDPIE